MNQQEERDTAAGAVVLPNNHPLMLELQSVQSEGAEDNSEALEDVSKRIWDEKVKRASKSKDN